MQLMFAPVQGHTDAAYRHFHNEVYGDACIYFTPFIRLERNSLRNRDVKDFTGPLNDGISLIPQVIFKNHEELSTLVSELRNLGAKKIDINMGCPFPLQTARGRGAATIARPEAAQAVESVVTENPDIIFSVKMRLGMTGSDEWQQILPILNRLPLSHITLHPRVASQQYKGHVDMEAFETFSKECERPLVYNGDLRTPQDVIEMQEKYPGLAGIMSGRGLLARPSLAAEVTEGREWTLPERLEKMMTFHRLLLDHYQELLCGDAQVISKISPFWEYAEPEIGHKAWKALKKASNMAKYHTALSLIPR